MKIQILRNAAVLGLFFMLAVATVHAQTPRSVEVNVPFDFHAGSTTLKAGVYTVKPGSGSTLLIRSIDGETSALVNAPLTIGSRESKAGERLVFNRFGEQYFLSQVWLSVETGRQLFVSGAETRAAREYNLASRKKPERVEVAARRG